MEDPRGTSRVFVGRIRRAIGLRGEVLVEPAGGDRGRFLAGAQIWVEAFPPRRLSISKSRRHGTGVAVSFAAIDTPEAAEELSGKNLTVEPEELPPLPTGTYYHYQIIGLEVVDAQGVSLGRVESILQTGVNDVYCVGKGESEILIPAIRDYIEKVDLPAGRILLAVGRQKLGVDEPPI